MEQGVRVKNIGLRGVTVADTKISYIDGDNGILMYRGYRIEDLAKRSSFPSVPSGIHLRISFRKSFRYQDAPRLEEFMVAQDIMPAVTGLYFEIAERHALGIKVTFVPSVKDARNFITLVAPVETIRFLRLAVFVPR